MKRYKKLYENKVAEIILQQLGGRKFLAMTGAKNLLSDKDALSFKIPKAKQNINYVKIVLNYKDTYNVEFGKVRGINYDIIKKFDDVYAEDLQRIFTDVTGLDTHL